MLSIEILSKLKFRGITEDVIYEIVRKYQGAFSYDDLEKNYYNHEVITPELMVLILGQLSDLEEKGYIIRGKYKVNITLKWEINRFYQKKGWPFWAVVIPVFVGIIAYLFPIPLKNETESPQSENPKKVSKGQSTSDSIPAVKPPFQNKKVIKDSSLSPLSSK